MSPCDGLVCFAHSVGKILLAFLTYTVFFHFPLPLPNSFLRVYLSTVCATVWNFHLKVTTSAVSGTAKSNRSAPPFFAAGTTFSRKTRIAVLPRTCARAPCHRPRCRPKVLQKRFSSCLEGTIM